MYCAVQTYFFTKEQNKIALIARPDVSFVSWQMLEVILDRGQLLVALLACGCTILGLRGMHLDVLQEAVQLARVDHMTVPAQQLAISRLGIKGQTRGIVEVWRTLW